jgi:hypothetical protein
MKKLFAVLFLFSTPAFAQITAEPLSAPAAPSTITLDCAGSAVTKKYAGNFWLVSLCSDGKSLAFVASEGNPARPSTIMRVNNGGEVSYVVESKPAAEAALVEIKALDAAAIDALAAETKGAK